MKRTAPHRWLKGSMVALVTPFDRKGELDLPALRRLVRFHRRHGTSALVPCGTTGESATLSHEEHNLVIETVIEESDGRLPVIAGTGSNNTREAARLTRHAEAAGADAALVISPYYNKPTPEGLYRHFRAVAESVRIPIVLYNIASRTGVNIPPALFERLAKIPNIAGVKEASGSLEQMTEIRSRCGERFALISGDDALTLPILSIGGTGVISVLANLLPRETAELIRLFDRKQIAQAQRLHARLLPIIQGLFLETNPIPVKTAMAWRKQIPCGRLRLPMCEMSSENEKRWRALLRTHRLLR
ncbi:MAG: 4-hydroxy-tetrahydrodipicolinate synthase [Candidatus Omnitrophica bacterium CG11_big_fil_rev_8_21_14_0_20_64_10]|nr:MAG: 4-hydroxy-tetrahydrodipicolinate synthase [Candidatus Omnitrophica bacterium CG11_big_fil_rev_8_21_14_0_20_64_10]